MIYILDYAKKQDSMWCSSANYAIRLCFPCNDSSVIQWPVKQRRSSQVQYTSQAVNQCIAMLITFAWESVNASEIGRYTKRWVPA